MRTWLFAIAVTACSNPPPSAAPDAPVTDAPAGQCADLAVDRTTGDPASRADQLVAELHDKGQNGASSDVGPDELFVRDLHVPLETSTRDPAAAAIAWIASLDHDPFVPGELSFYQPPDWSSDSPIVILMRTSVAGRPTRFARPAAQLALMHQQDGWQLASITLWSSVAWATAAEVDALTACTTDTPPPETSLRATTFEGALFTKCEIDGSYQYAPKSPDVVTWQAAPVWEAYDAQGRSTGPIVEWRIRRKATLTLDPVDYFPDIGRSDCACSDVAGFEMDIDGVSGEVIRYTPGINCVTC